MERVEYQEKQMAAEDALRQLDREKVYTWREREREREREVCVCVCE